MDPNLGYAIGAGAAIIAAAGAGVGIGVATSGFIQAIARQPEATNKLMVWFFVGCALAESTAIYGLVISLLLFNKIVG